MRTMILLMSLKQNIQNFSPFILRRYDVCDICIYMANIQKNNLTSNHAVNLLHLYVIQLNCKTVFVDKVRRCINTGTCVIRLSCRPFVQVY